MMLWPLRSEHRFKKNENNITKIKVMIRLIRIIWFLFYSKRVNKRDREREKEFFIFLLSKRQSLRGREVMLWSLS